jgi:hypothetical protein
MRFQVLTAVSMKMTAVWYIVPCCLVEVDQHFRRVTTSIMSIHF